MAFVETEDNRLVVGVNHFALRNVEIGQKAEVVLNVQPGKVFSGTVFTGQLDSQVCVLVAERGVASGHGVMAYRCTGMPTDQRDVVTRLWASEW